MAVKIILEVIVLWIWFAVFMGILVRKRGPLGGIQYYPKEVKKRVVELGLITEEQIKKQAVSSSILLLISDILIPFFMIIFINGARTYWDCAWQYYVLFMGQELYDWFVVDVWWVAISAWWIIPGTEDLLPLWHDPIIKFKGKLKLPVISIPLAAIVGGLYFLIGMLLYK